jgi:exonuclease SbcC
MTGLRSFVEMPEPITFDRNLGLFAIVGETGAGKSSILNAIIYALWNKCTWDERGSGDLVSTGENQMAVDFEFEARGERFKVSRRTPAEGATGFKRPAVHRLQSLDEPTHHWDTDTAIKTKVSEILGGMDLSTFRQSVILPQDEFSVLLRATETDRAKVLTQILELGVLNKYAEVLARPLDIAKKRDLQLEGRLQGIGENPEQDLTKAEAQLQEERERVAEFEASLDRLRKAEAAEEISARAIGDFDALDSVLSRSYRPVVTLEGLQPLAVELVAERAQLDERHAKAQRAKDDANKREAELAKAKRDEASLRCVLATLAILATQQSRIISLKSEREGRGTRQVELSAEVERRRQTVEQHRQERQALQEELIRLGSERDAMDERGQKARSLFERYLGEANRLVQDRTELAKREREQRTILGAIEKAQADAAGVAAQLVSARKSLEAARLANLVAAVAREVLPGDPCPVCRQAVPHDFKRPHEAALDSLEQRASELEHQAEKAKAVSGRAEAASIELDHTIAKLKAKMANAESELEGLRKQAEHAGADMSKSDVDTALAGLRDFAGKIRAAEKVAHKRLALVDAAWQREGQEQGIVSGELRTILQRIGELDSEMAEARSKIAAAFEQLSGDFKPANGDAEAIAAAQLRASEAMSYARQAVEDERKASSALNDVLEQLRTHERREQTELFTVRETALRTLESIREALDDVDLPVRPASHVHADLLAWARALHMSAQVARKTLAVTRATAVADRDHALAEASAILKAHGVDSHAALELLCNAARGTAGAAEEATKQARERIQRATAARAARERLKPRLDALVALNEALKPSAFPSYAVEQRQRSLLQIADKLLVRMTRERLGFRWQTGKLMLRECETQAPRTPDTLSGGEKFLASLSLALAVVELATGSGKDIGAVFLDEGFGSLDPNTQDLAIDELQRQAAGGRMIGIITHVTSVAARIDRILRVTRDAVTSRTTWTSGDDPNAPELRALTAALAEVS